MITLLENRILGIDPGTKHVGYGIIDTCGHQFSYVSSGTISVSDEEVAIRLVKIHQNLQSIISEYQPSVASIESVFIRENPQTAIRIGEARGVAMLSAAELGLSVIGYEPAVVKRCVTGSGRADKNQIQCMVKKLLGISDDLETDHESDALALAITHARHSLHFSALSKACVKLSRRSTGNRPRRSYRKR